MSEIAILVNGAVQWRFQPHREAADEIITPREVQLPPVPIGAEVLRVPDEQLLGTVRCVRKEPFSRWAIVLDPPAAETISQEITPAADADISQEIPGTPITALSDHLDPRVIGTVEQIADSVEELTAKTDEALRAIDGIGPKRLEEIRAACEVVLVDG